MTIALSTIKRLHKKAGGHFFDPQAIQFFSSELEEKVYEGPGGVFFVTSERFGDAARHFTVRAFYPDTGGIVTRVGYLDTLKEADVFAKVCAQGEPPP